MASIRAGVAPVDFLAGFRQPLAKTLVMGDLNAVLMVQLARVGLLAARDVGVGAGDLVDSKFFPRVYFQMGSCGWTGGGSTLGSVY